MSKKWFGIGFGFVLLAGVVFLATRGQNEFSEESLEKQKNTSGVVHSDEEQSLLSKEASVNPETIGAPGNISEEDVFSQIDALISSNAYEAALTAINQWLDHDIPPYVRERLFLYKGNLLYATGDLQHAYEVYRKLLLEGNRDDVRGWATVKLYSVAGKLSMKNEVFQEFETLYAQRPDNLRLGYILADLNAYQQDAASEIAVRTTLLVEDPGNLENGMKLIAAYKKSNNRSAAAAVAGNLALSDPDNRDAHLLRQAMLFIEANDNDKALPVCNDVFTLRVANLVLVGVLSKSLNKKILSWVK